MGEALEPLVIDAVTAPGGGVIGMCACPGGRALSAAPEALAQDIAAISAWGAEGIVSLIESEEFWALGIRDLPTLAERADLWWAHLPIMDMRAPDEYFESRWAGEAPRLRQVLRGGGRFVIHCWAGLGRTGTVAARLLVELGVEPVAAIAAVRDARPGAIQTPQQADHVLTCRRVE